MEKRERRPTIKSQVLHAFAEGMTRQEIMDELGFNIYQIESVINDARKRGEQIFIPRTQEKGRIKKVKGNRISRNGEKLHPDVQIPSITTHSEDLETISEDDTVKTNQPDITFTKAGNGEQGPEEIVSATIGKKRAPEPTNTQVSQNTYSEDQSSLIEEINPQEAQELLSILSDQEKVVLRSRINGNSYEDLAEELGCDVKAVYDLETRGLLKLRNTKVGERFYRYCRRGEHQATNQVNQSTSFDVSLGHQEEKRACWGTVVYDVNKTNVSLHMNTDSNIQAEVERRNSIITQAFKRNYQHMVKNAQVVVGSLEGAEEAAQIVFERLVKNMTTIPERPEAQRAYLTTAVKHAALDTIGWLRRRSATSLDAFNDKEAGGGMGLQDVIEHSHGITGKSAEDEALLSMDEESFDKRLEALRAEEPEIYLSVIDGYSYEEIAKLKHIALGTVKSRVSRGKQRLRLTQQIA